MKRRVKGGQEAGSFVQKENLRKREFLVERKRGERGEKGGVAGAKVAQVTGN